VDKPKKLKIKWFRGKAPKVIRVDRPWGWFEKFAENEKCTVKIINVNGNEGLSFQRHKDRHQLYFMLDDYLDIFVCEAKYPADEVWGAGRLIENTKIGDMFYFPAGVWHSAINNHSRKALRYLEVAWGHNDEKDIVRAYDKYGRK
jgi:mannose-6-phosphate isomerase-like protein (cupin superfamily)